MLYNETRQYDHPAFSMARATHNDFELVCKLFEAAILFQRQQGYIGWNNYDEKFIMADIDSAQLFKLMHDEVVAGIFSICYADRLIWRAKEQSDALYLHRIIVNRDWKGQKIFPAILEWSKETAAKSNRRFIRMDTWAGNAKLIAYYQRHGFAFVENYTTPVTSDLPLQHRNLPVTLLQYDLL